MGVDGAGSRQTPCRLGGRHFGPRHPDLHNGSVPTIAALLDSARRPRYWRHAGDTPAFDQAALGWAYDRLEAGKAGTKTREERARIYDTDQPGYGNQGHDIGDGLDPEERLALIEYLKTL